MQRINHDLTGIAQRLTKLSDKLEVSVQVIEDLWKDDVGRAFLQQNISNIAPQINQLASELAVTIEEFENIAKQIQDPDRH